MENEYQEKIDYSFLEKYDVQKSFADLHATLLSGKHISSESYTYFSLLDKYSNHWDFFYRTLYKLKLESGIYDGYTYYYLNQIDSDKISFKESSNYRALTELQTIIGLVLLDMYYKKYFEEKKIINWIDIKTLIEESEYKENYQKIFFGSIRSFYSDAEWTKVYMRFKDTIKSFNDFGWTNRLSGQSDELIFEIKPAIHRLGKLYEQELQDLSNLANKINKELEQ